MGNRLLASNLPHYRRCASQAGSSGLEELENELGQAFGKIIAKQAILLLAVGISHLHLLLRIHSGRMNRFAWRVPINALKC